MAVMDCIRRARWLARTALARDVYRRPQAKVPKLRLGNQGARWCVCTSELCPESIVYSFGIGMDISFDLELIRRFGLTVHAFDPTPRSRQWLSTQALPPQFVFHDVGIAAFDGVAKFLPPSDAKHVSFSTVHDSGMPGAKMPVQRLVTIASKLGHRGVDLLKMDIEGAEYSVIDDILGNKIPIGQLLVEFHHRWPEVGVAQTRRAIAKLNAWGFQIFDVSPSGEEYSFTSTVSQ